MAQAPPPFFFSYAHNDVEFDDRALQFYTNVNQRVRIIAGLKDDGFFDKSRLKAGDDWSVDLVAALGAAPVMVCLYSPSYFASEVCGQELQIFLERRVLYLSRNVGRPP